MLTAAHCDISDIAEAEIWIGSVCPYENDNCGQPRQIVNVERRFVHPEFGSGTGLNNDFALLKLETRANANPVTM